MWRRRVGLGACTLGTVAMLWMWGRSSAGNDKVVVDHAPGNGSYWILSGLSCDGSCGVWWNSGQVDFRERRTLYRYLGPREVRHTLPGGVMGFVFKRDAYGTVAQQGNRVDFYMVPCWFLAGLMGAWPAGVIWRGWRVGRRRAGWCCAHCGYSQRGARVQCTECGRDAMSGEALGARPAAEAGVG